MTAPDIAAWLVAGYALALVGVAWVFDRMARSGPRARRTLAQRWLRLSR